MLPRALRGSFVEEESINIAGDCRMREENSVVYSFFNFCMDQSASRKRNGLKIQPRDRAGAKRNKESLVSFSGDDLEREENVEIHKTDL